MSWLSRFFQSLAPVLRWWRTEPQLGAWLVLGSIAFMLICQMAGYEQPYLPWMPSGGQEIPRGWQVYELPIYFYYYVTPYLDLLTTVSLVALGLYAVRVMPNIRRLMWPVLAVGIVCTASLINHEVYDRWYTLNQSKMGEPVSLLTYLGKLVMLMFLCLSPALMLMWYSLRSSLERYTLRTFLQPLVFCFIAFFSLFILMDLISNMREYQDSKTPFSAVLRFYGQLMPAVFVMIAPWACLLATLFSLVKMSRHNEIISMLTAGLSLWQIARPLIIVGVYVSALGMALNYHWAPHAESQRKALTELVNNKTRTRYGQLAIANTVVFYNPKTRRLWYLGRVPFDTRTEPLNRVEVRQFDEKGRLEHTWLSLSAKWWPSGTWTLNNGREILYKEGLEIDSIPFIPHPGSTKGSTTTSVEFEETPWSIISASLVPDDLGVAELAAYLEANQEQPRENLLPFRTHLHDRFARPWLALCIVFSAVPFGVAFSRRAALGGMAGAMALVVGLLFMPELFANLGKGGHLSPRATVWMPHLIFLTAGGGMFYLKSLNKEIPRFSWTNLQRWAQIQWRNYRGV